MGARCVLHDPIGSLTVKAHIKHTLCLALWACSDDSLDNPTVHGNHILQYMRSTFWPLAHTWNK